MSHGLPFRDADNGLTEHILITYGRLPVRWESGRIGNSHNRGNIRIEWCVIRKPAISLTGDSCRGPSKPLCRTSYVNEARHSQKYSITPYAQRATIFCLPSVTPRGRSQPRSIRHRAPTEILINFTWRYTEGVTTLMPNNGESNSVYVCREPPGVGINLATTSMVRTSVRHSTFIQQIGYVNEDKYREQEATRACDWESKEKQ